MMSMQSTADTYSDSHFEDVLMIIGLRAASIFFQA